MEDEDLSELSGKTMNDLDIYDISNAHLDDDYYDSDNKAAVVLNSGVWVSSFLTAHQHN